MTRVLASAATQQRIINAFADVGHAAREAGVLREAATSFADQLVAEGYGWALAEVTAAFWSANTARLAHRDRWAAYERERANLDKTGQEPPPPPQPEPDPKPEPPPTPDPGGDQ